MRIGLSAIAAVACGLLPAQEACFSASPPGVLLGNTPDTVFAAQPIGFPFSPPGIPFPMTDIHISDHGVVFLSASGWPPPPPASSLATPVFSFGTPAIAALWTDVVAGGPDAGVWFDSTPFWCTVTWRNVHEWGNPANRFSMSLRLWITGAIEFHLGLGANNVTTLRNFGQGLTGTYGTTPSNLSAGGQFNADAMYEVWSTLGAPPNPFDLAGYSLGFQPVSGFVYSAFLSGPAWGCAQSVSYGNGCFGLSIGSNSVPYLGNSSYALTTSGVPSPAPLAFLFFGDSVVSPGVDLTGVGMPGCFASINANLGSFTFPVVSGSGVYGLPIPSSGIGIGTTLTAQSVALSPSTPLGLITSNGHRIVIGF